jgi:hypothetical protein
VNMAVYRIDCLPSGSTVGCSRRAERRRDLQILVYPPTFDATSSLSVVHRASFKNRDIMLPTRSAHRERVTREQKVQMPSSSVLTHRGYLCSRCFRHTDKLSVCSGCKEHHIVPWNAKSWIEGSNTRINTRSYG